MQCKGKWLSGILVLLALSMMPIRTSAASFTAKIQSVLLYSDGNLVYVYPEGGVPNAPACHGSNGNYMSFSMARPMAKSYLAALLAAQLAGKSVIFRTYGQCIDQSVSDTLAYFSIEN